MNTLNKLQGKAKNVTYPQPENTLGECMVKYGRDLGSDSSFGRFERGMFQFDNSSFKSYLYIF